VCGGLANAEDTESVLKKKWSEYEGGPGYNVKQDGDSLIEINQKWNEKEGGAPTAACKLEAGIQHRPRATLVTAGRLSLPDGARCVLQLWRREHGGGIEGLHSLCVALPKQGHGLRIMAHENLVTPARLNNPQHAQCPTAALVSAQVFLRKRRDLEIMWSMDPAKTKWKDLRKLIKAR